MASVFIALGNRAELGITPLPIRKPDLGHYEPQDRLVIRFIEYGEVDCQVDLGSPTIARIDELIDHLQRLKVFCD